MGAVSVDAVQLYNCLLQSANLQQFHKEAVSHHWQHRPPNRFHVIVLCYWKFNHVPIDPWNRMYTRLSTHDATGLHLSSCQFQQHLLHPGYPVLESVVYAPRQISVNVYG